MSQPGLIETILIIETLGLENDSKTHDTPAVSFPLHAYKEGAIHFKKLDWNS